MQPHFPDPTLGSELRYLPIESLPREVTRLDDKELTSPRGESLGTVAGFLVDSASGRPEYVVLDAGQWFRSRQYLLPVEFARVDAARRGLRTDLDRETVERFPELPAGRVDALRRSDLIEYRDRVTRACCPDDTDLRRIELERRDDREGAWWSAASWLNVPGAPTLGAASRVGEQFVSASEERTRGIAPEHRPARPASEQAQPGDVIGIESGGETLSLGDAANDEHGDRPPTPRDD